LDLIFNDTTIVFHSKENSRIRQLKISQTRFFIYLLVLIAIVLVLGNYTLDVLLDLRYHSKVESLEKNNQSLKNQLTDLGTRIEFISTKLTSIEKSDDEIRMVMGIPELDDDTRDVGIGGAEYKYNLDENLIEPQIAENLNDHMVKIDKLERIVNLEITSFENLHETFIAKEDSIRHMPALHPVLEGRITSDFGMRIHPIYKKRSKHPGIDFGAKTGTPIYAAADGIIKLAKYNGGYGKCVFIDHLYGFETRYGHMQQILVRRGGKVKRGDKIGLVGKTGTTTAPHLHFEIHFKGEEVDPNHYFFDDPALNKEVVADRQ
jgi:murein DD-endopeptidase MepM/ murein hydrolase activator NlpD